MAPNPKQAAAEHATRYIENHMIVGLGTGSTAYFAIVKLAEMVAAGLDVRCIPTSETSARIARERGIPLTSFADVDHIDLTIDGADEVDPAFNLTKGGGGALLREKFVASASSIELIVVDESKIRERLGQFPLPVEVVPFGWQLTHRRIEGLGCHAALRSGANTPFTTDNGNYILDCSFGRIEDPPELEQKISAICGVVECGIFTDLADRIIVGMSDGTVDERMEKKPLV